ncbi:MAG: hypothetical protein ACI82S_003260 [Patiriisocius sp.]|jgi:hypothetical protein
MAGSYASLYAVKTPHLLYLYAALYLLTVNLNDNFVAHLTDVLVDQDSNERDYLKNDYTFTVIHYAIIR